jgi:hypothetical protein
MVMDTTARGTSPHPSPHRARVGSPALLFAFGAAPAAWLLQLVVNFGLAIHPCFPQAVARTEPLAASSSDRPALLIVNLLAIAVALLGSGLSWRYWRGTRSEAGGATPQALGAGEGRTRFVAVCGLMAGAGFLVAIVFGTISLFMVPLCAG